MRAARVIAQMCLHGRRPPIALRRKTWSDARNQPGDARSPYSSEEVFS